MMRFSLIVDDSFHMPWAIPVDGSDPLTVVASIEEMDGLIRPVMVIDYEESKAWRVGRDESGWYLSDSASVKMGVMTQPEHITRDTGTMGASCES